jgi:hypothetical protein
LEVEATCARSVDCAEGLVCGGDGACRDACASDAECIGTQLCTQGVCAEPAELDESGKLPQTLPLATCRLNSDCATGSLCVHGACLPECVTDRDCGAAQQCAAGACVDVEVTVCACRQDVDCAEGETCDGCACQPGPAKECEKSADCATGQPCIDGACGCRCVEDRDCPASFSCDGCSCQAPAAVTVIRDATVSDGADLGLMRGIIEVETTLLVQGADVVTTLGLEELQTVGQLDIRSTNFSNDVAAPNPLAGLSGLTLVRGDLNLFATGGMRILELNPALEVGGNVTINSTLLSCSTIDAFEQTLRAHGFNGTVTGSSNGGCSGECVAGVCDGG